MTTEKAKVATVKIGQLEVEGLHMPNGEYRIGLSQLGVLVSVTQNYASQTFKRLLGEGFQSHKTKSELNSKEVVVVTLEQFATLIKLLAKAGNEQAYLFYDPMFGLSLHGLFCVAFGEKKQRKKVDKTSSYGGNFLNSLLGIEPLSQNNLHSAFCFLATAASGSFNPY